MICDFTQLQNFRKILAKFNCKKHLRDKHLCLAFRNFSHTNASFA